MAIYQSTGLLLLIACLSMVTSSYGLKIAAFNIQVFGKSKMDKADVVDSLVKIIRRYDIILIQEIRDSSGTAILELLDKVNEGPSQYLMKISERLGRTSSKEQYAFFYKPESGISVKNIFQYPDPQDSFERPPYAIRFTSPNTDISDFVLVGIHISPEEAFEEINALKDVHAKIRSDWSINDILILGDFNADCSYLSNKKKDELIIRTAEYKWWIGDDVDTTVSASDCAYDRFVMTGDTFISAVIQESAKVYKFDQALGLDIDEAKKVSDHYPIEIDIQDQGKKVDAIIETTGQEGTTTVTAAGKDTEETINSYFKIGAFNVQIFGLTKSQKPEIMDILVKIIQEYDIILIQEIRDASGDAIDALLKQVNKNGKHKYDMVISERLGRTVSKEQYAFFYRKDIGLRIIDTYQYSDPKDIFQREPFAVRFYSDFLAINEFVLMAIHTSPEYAFEEVNALKDAHDVIMKHYRLDNILIMGDFNADCSYMSNKKKEENLLRSPEFTWWISDDVDTTVTKTDCAYDRFVMSGKEFKESVAPNSARVFHFDQKFGLTETEAEDVSDHYPIELSILPFQDVSSATKCSSCFIDITKMLPRLFELFTITPWLL